MDQDSQPPGVVVLEVTVILKMDQGHQIIIIVVVIIIIN